MPAPSMAVQMPLTKRQLEQARATLTKATTESVSLQEDLKKCDGYRTRLEHDLGVARTQRQRRQMASLQEKIREVKGWSTYAKRQLVNEERTIQTNQQLLDTNDERLAALVKAQKTKAAASPPSKRGIWGGRVPAKPKTIHKRTVKVPRSKNGSTPSGVSKKADSSQDDVTCNASTASKPTEETGTKKVQQPAAEPTAQGSRKRKSRQDEEALDNERSTKKMRRSDEAATQVDDANTTAAAASTQTAQRAAASPQSSDNAKRKADQVEEPHSPESPAKKPRTSPEESSSEESQAATPPAAQAQVEESNYELRGLYNIENACFANAALQVLNCALSREQIMMLRGQVPGKEPLPELDLFGLQYEGFQWTSSKESTRKEEKKHEKNLEKLRSRAGKAARAQGHLKVAPYLGQLLLEMREGTNKASEEGTQQSFVSPIVFQQVFAYSDGEAEKRLAYNGDTQESSMEYLLQVVDTVAEEGHEFMRNIFGIKKVTAKKCEACGTESTEDELPDTRIQIRPFEEFAGRRTKKAPADRLDLEALLDKSIVDGGPLEGARCDECNSVDRRTKTTTIAELPEHILVQLDRAMGGTAFAAENKAARKFTATVDWHQEGAQFEFGDDHYEVAAVIRHRGQSCNSGHYTALVKHNGKWNYVNDEARDANITAKRMADNGALGHSAGFLLRKMPR